MATRAYLRIDDRRRHLLDAAARLFAREGYAGLTMVALATEAGVSRRLVYDHFPDLATLYAAFFEDRAAQYLAGIDEALREARSPGEAFAVAFAELLAMPADDQRAVRVLIADPGLADLQPVRDEFRRHVEQRWLPAIPATDTARPDPVQTDEVRAVLWTTVGGLFALAELVSRGEIPHDTALAIGERLVASMRALPAP